MNDRIRQLMEYYHLSPSEFAEKVGAQRSAVSHILSGRNKPGLDFIQKILGAFPEINAAWFVMGRGKLTGEPSNSDKSPEPAGQNSDYLHESTGNSSNESENVPQIEVSGENTEKNVAKKIHRESPRLRPPVEKIIILYGDNTFSEYNPAE